MQSKSTPVDEPGAFPAREWLRKLVVGKQVSFETRKQGASAGDRVYGWLFLQQQQGEQPLHLAVECVRQGHGTPKSIKYGGPSSSSAGDGAADDDKKAGRAGGGDAGAEQDDGRLYEAMLAKAYSEAKEAHRGIHESGASPVVRRTKNAGDDFEVLSLVEACRKLANQGRILCVVEYVFDGSRFRCQIVDPQLGPEWQYASFTLLLSGVSCPRMGNPKADPPIPTEQFSSQARQFTETRLLQRELPIALVGTDKAAVSAVGTVYHPAGNIAVELLKNGLARMSDWSVRLMPPVEVPALRVAENAAKRKHLGVWHSYAPPVLSTASSVVGQVVEVLSGDMLLVLPSGKNYDDEKSLLKLSLASIRSPRMGNERAGRPDEPYAFECKEYLRNLVVGKEVKVEIHYERDIPMQPGVEEKRPFGTLSVGKHSDVAELLISEGLAVTQRHRDDDEKSPRYDELRAAEAVAKAAKKGVHKEAEYKAVAINDLTDQRKAKAYSGSLMRAGTLKGIVDFVFNGALFKIWIQSENCHIRFSPNYIRCPQPSPSPGSRQQERKAEPFGDESKRHARLSVLQRQVEIQCSSVTNSGIIVGSMHVGFGKNRRDYTLELVGAGLATVDQRKIDYGEAPKHLVDAQTAAQQNKVGLWSVERPEAARAVKVDSKEKFKESVLVIRLSEIRSGSHFFYQVANDEASKVMDESMKLFTQNNGTAGGPCDVKIGKVVAALFDDGTGKSWYRAKIVERKGPSQVQVLFIDHGNLATVPVATHLRPLDDSLGADRIPPVAKEAVLALVQTRPLSSDEGVDAAHMFQRLSWGKDLKAKLLAPDENGKMAVTLSVPDEDETINVQLVSDGLARVAKPAAVSALAARMADDGNTVVKLAADLNVAQEAARKSRSGMWRYGDIGDDDDDEL